MSTTEKVQGKLPHGLVTGLQSLPGSLVDLVPDVLADNVDGLLQDKLMASDEVARSVRRGGAALASHLPGADDVRRGAISGLQQAGDVSRLRRRRSADRGSRERRRVWRRGVVFLALGIGVSIIVRRMMRTGRPVSADDPWTDRAEARPSSTVTAEESFPPLDNGRRPVRNEQVAFHSDSTESGSGGVYHDHRDCSVGQRIKPEHRVSGTDGRTRCKECQNLAAQVAT